MAGSRRELTPALVFQIVSTLRLVSTEEVRYTTWVAESWRFLQWAEPQAKLFWEMLTLIEVGSQSQLNPIWGGQGAQWGVAVHSVSLKRLSVFLLLHIHEQKHSSHDKAQAFNTHWVGAAESSPVIGYGSAPPLSPTRSPVRGGSLSPKRVGSPGFSPTRTPPMSPKAKIRGPMSPGSPGSPHLSSPGMMSPRSSPSPSSSRHHRLFARSSEEAERLRFLKRHLMEMLLLVSSEPRALQILPPFPSNSEVLSQVEITPDDFEQLSFLLAAGPDLMSKTARLSEAASTLFSSAVKISATQTKEWLFETLTVNEVLYPSPPAPTGEASDMEGPIIQSPIPHNSQEPKQPWDRHQDRPGPGPSLGGASSTFLTGVSDPDQPGAPLVLNSILRTTVLHEENRASDTSRSDLQSIPPPLRPVQINHCHDSYIYLLGAFQSATVLGCTDCTVVLGAIAGLVNVVECERIQLVTCCRRIVVNNCLDSVFPVFTQSSPVLCGDNRTCQLAPFNTYYPWLPTNLQEAGLPSRSPPAVNFWNTPLDLTLLGSGGLPSRSPSTSNEDSEISPMLLPPDQFYSLTIPLSSPDAALPVETLFAVPPEYQKHLTERENLVNSIQNIIFESNLNEKQQREVEEAVRSKFSEWLITSGNLRQVLDLVQMEKMSNSTVQKN